jgi:uncharacterized protein YceH (UPF0502 family)
MSPESYKHFFTRRQQVVAMVTMEKNHLHSCETWVRSSVEAVIAQLEAQLVELEARLAQVSTGRPQWQE